jgi:hypothetical protein
MPEPSSTNKVATSPVSPGEAHRSPHRVSSGESPAPAEKPVPEGPSTEVFAVFGAEPEIQAYAMAKYSRSALSMKESLREISTQKAEKFLNTFYFQYGHRSIADLAHISLAIERLSILAAIELADEQRWDGQERSTRYQDFKKSGYFTPDFGVDDEARKLYRETLECLQMPALGLKSARENSGRPSGTRSLSQRLKSPEIGAFIAAVVNGCATQNQAREQNFAQLLTLCPSHGLDRRRRHRVPTSRKIGEKWSTPFRACSGNS